MNTIQLIEKSFLMNYFQGEYIQFVCYNIDKTIL